MAGKSTNREDYQQIRRPVGAMAKEFLRGHVSRLHRHRRAQLLYAVSGVLEITTAGGLWIVPPQRAVWIPPETDHEVRFATAASVRTLYISAQALPAAPAQPCLVEVSPLLRELILAAVAMPLHYDQRGRDGRVIALLLESIAWREEAPLHLMMPRDKRLIRIQQALRADPADTRGLEEWAKTVGASSRTLARLFRAELGLSFLHWRQQLRVAAALPLLATGTPVTQVALDLGYETASAFTAMFRRHMGVLPSRYFMK